MSQPLLVGAQQTGTAGDHEAAVEDFDKILRMAERRHLVIALVTGTLWTTK